MSTKNTVSIAIPDAELQIVKEAIATLKNTLSPYMIAISSVERQKVPKMGDGTMPFVEKVMEYAQEDGQFLPPCLCHPYQFKGYSQNLLSCTLFFFQVICNLSSFSSLPRYSNS